MDEETTITPVVADTSQAKDTRAVVRVAGDRRERQQVETCLKRNTDATERFRRAVSTQGSASKRR
jgi:hypothetical protein